LRSVEVETLQQRPLHRARFRRELLEIDVDHVVVGPYGVLVVESKFASSQMDLGADRLTKRLRDAIYQVEKNAVKVQGLLCRTTPDLVAIPVVVFWGRLVTAPKQVVRHFDTVRVVAGADAAKWRQRLADRVNLSPETVTAISGEIDRFASRDRPKE